MKTLLKSAIKKVISAAGYELRRKHTTSWPVDFTQEEIEDIEFCAPYATLVPLGRQLVLARAVEYLCDNEVPGAFAECGVFRGASVMMMMRTLLRLDRRDRDVFLYDTFSGMSEPTSPDVNHWGEDAHPMWEADPDWISASLAEVKANLQKIDYPSSKLHFIEGMVEETIPGNVPDELALLRLDTDWYVSTLHELRHLYPRLSPGGVLILDDYGHWMGARKAVDEYFGGVSPAPYLIRVDYSCRIAIKP